MAAHGLTILRQVRKRVENPESVKEDIVRLLDQALSAPGTCMTVGFDSNGWDMLNRAKDQFQNGDITQLALLSEIENLILVHMWMDLFPCMEAVQAAMYEANRNYPAMHSGGPRPTIADYVRSRKLITDRYPPEQRAPHI